MIISQRGLSKKRNLRTKIARDCGNLDVIGADDNLLKQLAFAGGYDGVSDNRFTKEISDIFAWQSFGSATGWNNGQKGSTRRIHDAS